MFEALERAIEEIDSIDFDGLTDDEANAATVEMYKLRARLDAQCAGVLGKWDTRHGWADDGSLVPAARLVAACRISDRTARRDLHRARQLRHMPVVAEAFTAGEISVDHVDAFARLRIPELADTFAEGEEMLVHHARRLHYRQFEKCITYWRHRADDTRALRDAQHRQDARYLDIARTFGGCTDIRGVLPPVDGGIVGDELRRLEQISFEADWTAARDAHGDQASLADLARTAKQRRADALVEMARRSAAAPPGCVPTRPLISVLVDYETFHGTLCELADGTVITPGEILPLITHADIERVVFDAPARVMEIGVKQRFFTGALRHAIEIRDRHCTHPGCSVPANRCQVDHILEYINDGPTSQENGRLLCPAHHRQRGRPQRALATGPGP